MDGCVSEANIFHTNASNNNGIAATGGRGNEGSMAINLEVNNHHQYTHSETQKYTHSTIIETLT